MQFYELLSILSKKEQNVTLTKEEYERFLPLFEKDSETNGTYGFEFVHFLSCVQNSLGIHSDLTTHLITQKYLHSIENNPALKERSYAYLCLQEAQYYMSINAGRECIIYCNRVLDYKSSTTWLRASATAFTLDTLFHSNDKNGILKCVNRIIELLDNKELPPRARILFYLALCDYYSINKDKENFNKYRDMSFDFIKNETNEELIFLTKFHIFYNEFYFDDIILTDKHIEDFKYYIDNIDAIMGITGDRADNIIPMLEKISANLEEEVFIEYMWKLIEKSGFKDKLGLLTFLFKTNRYDKNKYPELFNEYIFNLEKFLSSSVITNKQSIESAISEYELQKKYQEAALFDELTGLYSRYAYNNVVTENSKNISDSFYGVGVFDVNGLKNTNDTRGHAAGDELIKFVSRCISEIFGELGFCYRIGGDEFVVLFNKDFDEKTYKDKFKNIIDIGYESSRYNSVSFGFAYHKERPDADLSELVKLADKRMYTMKHAYYENSLCDISFF